MYIMPINVTGEDKWLGGKISLRQLGYLAAAVVFIALIITIPTTIVIKILLCLPVIAFALALAFMRIDDGLPSFTDGVSLDKYLLLAYMFRRSAKLYLWAEV